ncbi:cid1 family poly A polymerase domain-containing protein [Ditylenchus destructor]|nr:cid1 family poly A polymerase domain-containing protein [Ditylenchus destructor]
MYLHPGWTPASSHPQLEVPKFLLYDTTKSLYSTSIPSPCPTDLWLHRKKFEKNTKCPFTPLSMEISAASTQGWENYLAIISCDEESASERPPNRLKISQADFDSRKNQKSNTTISRRRNVTSPLSINIDTDFDDSPALTEGNTEDPCKTQLPSTSGSSTHSCSESAVSSWDEDLNDTDDCRPSSSSSLTDTHEDYPERPKVMPRSSSNTMGNRPSLTSRFMDQYIEQSQARLWLNNGFAMIAGPNAKKRRLPRSIRNSILAARMKQDSAHAQRISMPDFASQTCYSNCMNGRTDISKKDILSEQIEAFHQSVEQTEETLTRKLHLRDMLYYAISPIFPMCGLYIVGSSLNGFGNNKSDMDLCLMITNRDIDQRSDAVVVLSSIMRTLQTTGFIAEQQLILAKVPILRIKFTSKYSDITVDLNANNSVAIRNTHLLCYYSSFDSRVRSLVSVVKEWAKRRGINDANRSSFTSYSLVLMVIHYLQCGICPPVLPSLQDLYPKFFDSKADVRSLNVSIPLRPPKSEVWNGDNKSSLGELLLGFLQYYASNFNFDTDAISIRLGRKTERALVARNASPYNHLSQWHCICIEEPFTLSNTAHSIYDERIFGSIKKSFVTGFHELDMNRDLQSFLDQNSPTAETPDSERRTSE